MMEDDRDILDIEIYLYKRIAYSNGNHHDYKIAYILF